MTYVSAVIKGLNWCVSKPVSPAKGDCYFDQVYQAGYCYDGTNWVLFSAAGSSESPKSFVPTEEHLAKHPALKQAWDEYLVIWKLLGL